MTCSLVTACSFHDDLKGAPSKLSLDGDFFPDSRTNALQAAPL
jgi:hypothetical protein